MGDWEMGMARAIVYVEAHLEEEMTVRDIAAQAYLSPFYFQRLFSALCGVSVGEYIRNRRLTLAGEALQKTDEKVIDIAARYGYDSPDSFNRAFQRFHGLTPSLARKKGARLQVFAPVKMIAGKEKKDMLEYKIVEKPPFTLVGVSKIFHEDTGYQEIPVFWDEVMAEGKLMGMFGVCLDGEGEGKEFEYMIADNYIPWEEIPEGWKVRTVPAHTWAVFPCRGALPQALQDVNTKIWAEWLPSCREYCLAANMNLEMYAPPAEKEEDTYSEIWLPVRRKDEAL